MELHEELETIKTKEDFITFIGLLIEDYNNNLDKKGKNTRIDTYLEAIKSWVGSIESYYKNTNTVIPNILTGILLPHYLM